MKPEQQKAIVQRLAMDEISRRRKTIEQNVISSMSAAFMICLHDKFDFDVDAMRKLMGLVMLQFEAVQDKFVTVEDWLQWCREYGIEEG
jgi:hypothetical protein